MPYQDKERSPAPWVAIFVLTSILAHVLLFFGIIVLSLFVPKPKFVVPPPPPPEVSLSLQPAPPPAPPPPKKIFMPTQPQANAPHKERPVESDNDTQLTSQSKVARNNDSVMPDVVSKSKHPSSLENSPNNPTPNQQPSNPAPPTKQQQDKEQNQQAQKPQPQPAKPTDKPPQPQPPKPLPPQVTKNQQQIDPETGLPILPPINAPTLAPQSSSQKSGAPKYSVPHVETDIQGRVGMTGAPSAEAMATELGKYEARFHQAVASRWYPRATNQQSLIGVGMVQIQFTIHYDGTITTKVLQGNTGDTMLLQTISLTSIKEVSPFIPFSDSLRKQIGDDLTDAYTFSIYQQ